MSNDLEEFLWHSEGLEGVPKQRSFLEFGSAFEIPMKRRLEESTSNDVRYETRFPHGLSHDHSQKRVPADRRFFGTSRLPTATLRFIVKPTIMEQRAFHGSENIQRSNCGVKSDAQGGPDLL